jgi:hypothetical protein
MAHAWQEVLEFITSHFKECDADCHSKLLPPAVRNPKLLLWPNDCQTQNINQA